MTPIHTFLQGFEGRQYLPDPWKPSRHLQAVWRRQESRQRKQSVRTEATPSFSLDTDAERSGCDAAFFDSLSSLLLTSCWARPALSSFHHFFWHVTETHTHTHTHTLQCFWRNHKLRPEWPQSAQRPHRSCEFYTAMIVGNKGLITSSLPRCFAQSNHFFLTRLKVVQTLRLDSNAGVTLKPCSFQLILCFKHAHAHWQLVNSQRCRVAVL